MNRNKQLYDFFIFIHYLFYVENNLKRKWILKHVLVSILGYFHVYNKMARNISYLTEAIHISTCPLLSRRLTRVGNHSKKQTKNNKKTKIHTWSHFENWQKTTKHVKEIISSCRKQKLLWRGQVTFGRWLVNRSQVHQSHLLLATLAACCFTWCWMQLLPNLVGSETKQCPPRKAPTAALILCFY